MIRAPFFGLTFGLATTLLAATASSQQVEFPMDVVSAGSPLDGTVLAPRLDQIQHLATLDQVTLLGTPLPDGGTVDLELRRLDLRRLGFQFYVDGEYSPDLLDGLDLSVWRGQVIGVPESDVVLSFSTHGSRGWIRQPGNLVHLIGRPDADGDWVRGDVLTISEWSLGAQGMSLQNFCESAVPFKGTEEIQDFSANGSTEYLGGSSCGLKDCPIALETDFQFFQLFNDLGAATSYLTSLLAAISDRYETQIGTVLTFPYLQLYTTAGDPWTSQDGGGGAGDLLDEFRNAWIGNIPNGANLAHFVSGAGLGGGVAYLDVLCSPNFAFGVSGNIGGSISLPISQQSGNWDFMVIAHELGHNFAAPHTHDLNPQVDNCAGGAHITDGTIMSYCHLCPGGTSNITTFFHPANVANMTSAANGCLSNFGGAIAGVDIDFVDELIGAAVSAQVTGTPVGPVQVFYRYDGGLYQSINMSNAGGGLYTALLPAGSCDDTPEYYYSYTESTCGLVVDPATAPLVAYDAIVGMPILVVADDFETDMGWSASNLGASSGDWQRGVPVNDGGWDYDPSADFDGSGSAFMTQNEAGNTDVDDGSVQLTSPVLDMSSAGVQIQYAYYLRLTNADGTDALVVEMNTNGGSGAWTEIARHDTNGGLNWRTHLITEPDLMGLGITPSANSVVRFTANDGDTQSIVEAGLDAFEISQLFCDSGSSEPGSPFCFGANCPCGNDSPTSGCLNSSGGGAALSASGSTSVGADDLLLTTAGCPPNNNGLYFMGSSISSPVFVGDGVACTGGLFRYFPGTVNSFGEFTQTTPVASSFVGAITAGSTRHFQSWTRDVLCGPPPSPCPSPCGANSSVSNAYTVTFTP